MNSTIVDQAFKTRWGYVAYSYEDYKKLKRLNIIFQKARTYAYQWERWVRKAPHNRVRKIWKRDENRHKIGYTISGPLPEPQFCDIFFTKLVDTDRNPIGQRWLNMVIYSNIGYIRIDKDIATEYRNSHRPVETSEKVPEANMSSDEIDELLEKAEDWYNSINAVTSV